MKAAVTMILSASGSSSMPMVVICPRARQITIQAVGHGSEHEQNRCQNLLRSVPCHGKCGDRIHRNSGIMMIRLIVMELGRFMAEQRLVQDHYCTACACVM